MYAGTSFYPFEESLRALPSQQTVDTVSNYRLLSQAPTREYFLAQGLYPGRSLDFQRNKCQGTRFMPTPTDKLFEEQDDSDQLATAQVPIVTGQVYDGKLAPEEKRSGRAKRK
jgi:hypothetical protein